MRLTAPVTCVDSTVRAVSTVDERAAPCSREQNFFFVVAASLKVLTFCALMSKSKDVTTSAGKDKSYLALVIIFAVFWKLKFLFLKHTLFLVQWLLKFAQTIASENPCQQKHTKNQFKENQLVKEDCHGYQPLGKSNFNLGQSNVRVNSVDSNFNQNDCVPDSNYNW